MYICIFPFSGQVFVHVCEVYIFLACSLAIGDAFYISNASLPVVKPAQSKTETFPLTASHYNHQPHNSLALC